MKWTENIFGFLVVTGVLYGGLCCTKTEVPVYDQVTNFYRSPDEINCGHRFGICRTEKSWSGFFGNL